MTATQALPARTLSTDAPLVSFVVFSYNQASFLGDAITAAFAQTYDNLEIIISDDCSQDASREIIEYLASTYHGPHQVRLNFNPVNLGIGDHVNLVFELARGELIVLAAGDDISLPQRTDRIVEAWLKADRTPSAMYCGGATMNAAGERTGIVQTALAYGCRSVSSMISYNAASPLLLLGACSAYKPDVFTRFGALLDTLTVEDIPLAIRASLLGGIVYIDAELVLYRENVSVWLPRRLQNEDFDRHRKRMAHRIRANHLVSRQVFRDIRLAGTRDERRQATRRFLAARFSLRVAETHRLSLKAYLRVVQLTPYWRSSIFPAVLFACEPVHKALFFAKGMLSRNRS